MTNTRVLSAAIFAVVCTSHSVAQEIVYSPTNPSFGGSSFNSAHLLAIAAIDRPDPPSSGGVFGDGGELQSETDLFAERLERAILSRLSTQITNSIFGEDAQPSGEFEFGSTRVSFDTDVLDGTIDLRIVDTLSGDETRIQVPGSLRGQDLF